jgi:hypothetical protein
MNQFKKPLLLLAYLTILYASLGIANPFMVQGQGAGPNITVENSSADHPALTAIQAQAGFSQGSPTGVIFTVPAGHRLVIEHVSMRATGFFTDAVVSTTLEGLLANHALVVVNDPSSGKATVSQQTTFYADPETDVIFLNTGLGSGNTGLMAISGHLVPIP